MDPPADRVFFKREGKETMVFGEGFGSEHFMSIEKSTDGNWMMLTVSVGWNRSDIYICPVDKLKDWRKVYCSDSPAKPIDVINNKIYIYTREGNKGLGKVIAVKDNKIEEIIPEKEFPLEWSTIVNDKILACYLKNASSVLEVYNLDGSFIERIDFEIPGSLYFVDKNEECAILIFESFTVPYKYYKFKDKLEIIFQKEIKGNFEIDEDFAISKDGTKIHYFVVRKRETNIKKALVIGYGGFNIAMTPYFSPSIMTFVESGGTVVIANIRGGSEYGEEWYRYGIRENKQNVFDDFISGMKKLKKEGYEVVGWGSSNGGLLISAVLTQKPQLMNGALIGYPVIDMLRFHKLYIGSVWIPEYGNPDDPKDREFLLKYSPYHNVKLDQKYSPVLIYTGLHDDRVHPSHALKFAKKLKDVGAPVYLRVETKSGHMGASTETKIKELSEILAFVMKILNMKKS